MNCDLQNRYITSVQAKLHIFLGHWGLRCASLKKLCYLVKWKQISCIIVPLVKVFSYLCNKVGTEGTFLAKTVKEDPKIMAPVYNVPVGINKEYAQRVLWSSAWNWSGKMYSLFVCDFSCDFSKKKWQKWSVEAKSGIYAQKQKQSKKSALSSIVQFVISC